MVLERFLSWVAVASAEARAGAARSLVMAYSRPESEVVSHDHLDRMVAVLLDDVVVSVRQSLAVAAATSCDVPRHVVVALSRDDSIVAIPVLRASTLLTAADLAAAVLVGDDAVHQAVASRADVPAAVATLLAQDAKFPAVLTLCQNVSADLTATSLRLILSRFGAEGAIRSAILERDELDSDLRHEIVVATARLLTNWAVSRGWMSERRAEGVVREGVEKATVAIAATRGQRAKPDLASFVAYLRAESELTPALLLRSLLSGETGLFEAALGNLADMPAYRVAGPARAPSSLAFASLYARAAMPPGLLPTFRAAVAAAARCNASARRDAPAVVQAAVADVRAACGQTGNHAALLALLNRLEVEALRDDTRQRRHVLQVAPPVAPRHDIPVFTMSTRPVFRLPFRTAA